jgi:cephalosporin hydroxylase
MAEITQSYGVPNTPTDPLRSIPSTYAGHDALQWQVDFWLWEKLLNELQGIEAIIELGTGGGGFSLYLSDQARHRGIAFRTFDHLRHPGPDVPGMTVTDVFAQPESVFDVMDGRKVILHCDNGDKPRELAIFGARLSTGSMCVVHDWLTEVHPSDVPTRLRPILSDYWGEGRSMCAVFEAR